MTGGPDLTNGPLARAVLARGSWRPAGMLATQRLLGALAARRAPLLKGARSLQAWHNGLAQRWRPLETAQPVPRVARTSPVCTAGIAAPSAPLDGAATNRSPEPGDRTGRQHSGRAAPARIDLASNDGSRAQRLPAALPPVRSPLTITALAMAAGASAPRLPMPFRSHARAVSAAADFPTGGPGLAPAIGRRFARYEVAGGFPEAAAGAGETAAARTVALVRWRPVDGRPSEDDAHRRTGARPRGNDRAGDLGVVAPARPARWAEPPLPAHRTGPTADHGTPSAEPIERSGASDAIALSGLSLRLVPPEEAARRLAQGEDATGGCELPRGARSEAGAWREFLPSSAKAAIDIGAIVDRVQRELKRREQFERERKGLL